MSFFAELKRRNVFRVGIAYLIAAWLVMQFADVILNNIDAPDWVFQAVLLMLGIGLLFAIFFAWAFELTPEGIKKEKDVDRTQSITHNTGRKLDFIIIGVLVVALGYFAVDKFVYQPAAQNSTDFEVATEPGQSAPEAADQSIAVLPFVNMSEDASNEYFSDGITEEILNVLARIRGLKVAGRTSSFAFKGQNEDLRSIGEKLNVNTLLEGSVRKDEARQKVRVTVQLINVEDGYHIWSQSYDRSLEDIFAIQEEIATEVAKALKINLLGEQEQLVEVSRSDLNAYEWFLKGRKSLSENSVDSVGRAIDEFKQAIALDSDYLPAQLGLAEAYLGQGFIGSLPYREANALAEPLLTTALERDPENAEALALMGQTLILGVNPDISKAEEYLRLALDLNPRNVRAMQMLSPLLGTTGRSSESLEYARQAAMLEPYLLSNQLMLATILRTRGDIEEAQVATAKMREIEPDAPSGYYTEGLVYRDAGRIDQAVYWFVQGFELDPADPELAAVLTYWWLGLDDLQQAEKWLDTAIALDPDHPATLGARIRMLLAREMYSEARQVALQSLQLNLQNRWGYKNSLSYTLVDRAFDDGDGVEALRMANEIYSDAISSDAFYDPSLNQLRRLTRANLQLSIDPASVEALDTVRREKQYAEQVDRGSAPNYWRIVSAQIAMLEGDHATAVGHLREVFDRGGLRNGWRNNLTKGYLWRDLHEHPGYQQIISMLEAEAQEQRESAYKLIASLE